jgi:3'(2'), 5'-bisphosphate nucleotidase/myo-inositol-1(or 4)-monophosphatase
MQLHQADLESLCNLAIKAACEAGKMIASHTGTDLTVKIKDSTASDNSKTPGGESLASQVLTEVDIKSQQIILNHLTPTLSRYDLGLLSEESVDDSSRFEKDYFWCIDPLDGTLPFTESKPGYAVSIALVKRNGEPIIGIVYDPVQNNLYHAIKGTGAYKNNNCLIPTTANTFTLIIDRSFENHPDFTIIVNGLTKEAQKQNKSFQLIKHGGAAMNAIWVLQHSPACYFKFPKPTNGGGSLWDYAATACIFNETKGYASDIYGQPLDLNRKGSTFMNHKGILYTCSMDISKLINQLIKKVESKQNQIP